MFSQLLNKLRPNSPQNHYSSSPRKSDHKKSQGFSDLQKDANSRQKGVGGMRKPSIMYYMNFCSLSGLP